MISLAPFNQNFAALYIVYTLAVGTQYCIEIMKTFN